MWSNPTEKELVDFRIAHDTYLLMRVTYYISRLTPFKDSLKYWTNDILEKGFIQKWAADVIPKRNYSMLKQESKTLKMENFQPLFEIMLLGYGLALITFVFEIIYKFLDNYYAISFHIRNVGKSIHEYC